MQVSLLEHRTLKSGFGKANRKQPASQFLSLTIADAGPVKISFEYVASPHCLCSTRWHRVPDLLGTFSLVGMHAKWLHEENPGFTAGRFYAETG